MPEHDCCGMENGGKRRRRQVEMECSESPPTVCSPNSTFQLQRPVSFNPAQSSHFHKGPLLLDLFVFVSVQSHRIGELFEAIV